MQPCWKWGNCLFPLCAKRGYCDFASGGPEAMTLGAFQLSDLCCATVGEDFAAGHEATIL
jgi:hypothetical protein